MNRKGITAAVLSIILEAVPFAVAQTPVPGGAIGASSGAPSREEPKPPTGARANAPAEVDARHCLDFPTNPEVIACAEKYRSHKSKGSST